MIDVVVRAAALAGVYLLVLTSLAPGDIAMGVVLGLGVSAALRPRRHQLRDTDAAVSARGAVALLVGTAREIVAGTWHTVRFCLGSSEQQGFVEIPREDRTPVEVAVWGVLTAESPDEVVVDVDEDRDVLVVHLLDASDPDAVRERHRRGHARLHGRG